MKCQQITTDSSDLCPDTSPVSRSVVIADAGCGAWLVPAEVSGVPAQGVRFSFRGVTWEVTHYRPHARAWVAEPVSH
jgi:hypothetical protein